MAGETSKPGISTQVMNEVTLVLTGTWAFRGRTSRPIWKTSSCFATPAADFQVHFELRRVAAHYGNQ